MAKFEEVFADTKALFDKMIVEAGLDQTVNIKLLANNALKQIGSVVKANELLKHMTGEDVIILLNENVFEQVDDEEKKIIGEELLASISVNTESGKVSIDKGDVHTYSLLLTKHGYTKYAKIQTKINEIFAEIKAAEEMEKEGKAKTSNKGKKK